MLCSINSYSKLFPLGTFTSMLYLMYVNYLWMVGSHFATQNKKISFLKYPMYPRQYYFHNTMSYFYLWMRKWTILNLSFKANSRCFCGSNCWEKKPKKICSLKWMKLQWFSQASVRIIYIKCYHRQCKEDHTKMFNFMITPSFIMLV